MGDNTQQNQQCDGFKIFTFTESEIANIAAQYKTTSISGGFLGFGDWSAKNSYSDGVITYKIDPKLAKDTENIPSYVFQPDASHTQSLVNEQFSNLSILLGVTIQQGEGKTDLELTKFGAWDLFTTQEGFMGNSKNKIKFNPQTIYNTTHYHQDINLEQALELGLTHEVIHFLGIDHPEASNSEILKELAVFFQSSLITNAKGTADLAYNTKVVAPLDIYMLEKEMGRHLNYIDYYNLTGNISWPQNYLDGAGNNILRINLGEWAIDKETAIFEMPRKNPDGSSAGDIAIMTSTGFVVIPGALSAGYSGVDISITDANGQSVSLSGITYKNGQTISLADVKNSLGSALGGLSGNWLNLANSRVQNGSMPELDKRLNNECQTSLLQDTADIDSSAVSIDVKGRTNSRG